mmetsp:Transcript_33529/g.56301  ORF Transcript_33529/g.56301 Transcript_33529/m.56301 type:complete len:459 (+) Transcript_33529:514-1890(+)
MSMATRYRPPLDIEFPSARYSSGQLSHSLGRSSSFPEPESPQFRTLEDYSQPPGTPFLSVFDWTDRTPHTGGRYDGDDFTHIKKWWGGRGSLWKPVSNLERISRQEQRHVRLSLKDDLDGSLAKRLSRTQNGTRVKTAGHAAAGNKYWEENARPPQTAYPAMGTQGAQSPQSPRRQAMTLSSSPKFRAHSQTFRSTTAATSMTNFTMPNSDESSWENPVQQEEIMPYQVYTASSTYYNGRKYPPLKSKFNVPPTPPNRVMQQQWALPLSHKTAMRELSDETPGQEPGPGKLSKRQLNEQRRIDFRLKSLPVIAVTSANAVGGLIDLRELQERCKISDIDHKFVTQEEVDYLLATAGTDMSFIDNSGLSSIAALEKVDPTLHVEEVEELPCEERSLTDLTKLRRNCTSDKSRPMRNSIAFYGRVGGGKNLKEMTGETTILHKSLGGRFLTTPRFPEITA